MSYFNIVRVLGFKLCRGIKSHQNNAGQPQGKLIIYMKQKEKIQAFSNIALRAETV